MNIYSTSFATRRCITVGAALLWIAIGVACSNVSPNQRVADEALQAAHVSYTAGDYSRTIQLLRDSSAIETSDRRTRVEAHKLMAFSYCVIGRLTLCRAEFEKVLQLDPHFELSTAEKGHPIWGPAFEAARKRVTSS